jgi:hypothetical protein
MNSLMQTTWPTFELYQAIRGQIMGVLSDGDLSFSPGGTNLPLGELCREIGEVEQAYLASFQTFELDFGYRNTTPGLALSVAALAAWFAELDQQLKAVIEAFTDEQLEAQAVRRGPSWTLPIRVQLMIYQEALLIFYGKASVYLKALNKPIPEQMRNWIA